MSDTGPTPTRLLVVVAHPDDESFGTGSVIAEAARQGLAVTVCCATRGEAGANEGTDAVPDLAAAREAELREAAHILGAEAVIVLDYVDSGMGGEAPAGSLAAAPDSEVTAAVEEVVEQVRPDVVVTLDPELGDGHRDHVVIGRATTEAVVGRHLALYWWCLPREPMRQWAEHLRVQQPESEHLDVDAARMGRPEDECTALVDVTHLREVRARAIAAHRTQRPPFDVMPPELVGAFLDVDRFVQVQPPWSGGRPARSILDPRERW